MAAGGQREHPGIKAVDHRFMRGWRTVICLITDLGISYHIALLGGGEAARSERIEEPARLPPPQARIGAARGQEFGMGAFLDNVAVIEHDETVEAGDCREAMSDGDDRAPPHQPVELLLDRCLDLRIERRGGLVKDENGRVFEDYPRERDALPLAARQLDAALADMRVKAAPLVEVFESLDEFDGLSLRSGAADLPFGRLRAAVADVVADGAVQQRGVLRDHRDLRAQALLRDRSEVLPIDQDAAAFEIEEAQQQIDYRRLAGAGTADQADLFARPHGQAQAVDAAALAA